MRQTRRVYYIFRSRGVGLAIQVSVVNGGGLELGKRHRQAWVMYQAGGARRVDNERPIERTLVLVSVVVL